MFLLLSLPDDTEWAILIFFVPLILTYYWGYKNGKREEKLANMEKEIEKEQKESMEFASL